MPFQNRRYIPNPKIAVIGDGFVFVVLQLKKAKADNPHPKRLAGYRLCVYASGSVVTDVFNLLFTFR